MSQAYLGESQSLHVVFRKKKKIESIKPHVLSQFFNGFPTNSSQMMFPYD